MAGCAASRRSSRSRSRSRSSSWVALGTCSGRCATRRSRRPPVVIIHRGAGHLGHPPRRLSPPRRARRVASRRQLRVPRRTRGAGVRRVTDQPLELPVHDPQPDLPPRPPPPRRRAGGRGAVRPSGKRLRADGSSRIEEAAILDEARAAGYETITLASGFEDTEVRSADRFLDGSQMNDFELTVVRPTMLAPLAIALDSTRSRQASATGSSGCSRRWKGSRPRPGHGRSSSSPCPTPHRPWVVDGDGRPVAATDLETWSSRPDVVRLRPPTSAPALAGCDPAMPAHGALPPDRRAAHTGPSRSTGPGDPRRLGSRSRPRPCRRELGAPASQSLRCVHAGPSRSVRRRCHPRQRVPDALLQLP